MPSSCFFLLPVSLILCFRRSTALRDLISIAFIFFSLFFRNTHVFTIPFHSFLLMSYQLHWYCILSFLNFIEIPESLYHSHSGLNHYFHTPLLEWWLMPATHILMMQWARHHLRIAGNLYSSHLLFPPCHFVSPFGDRYPNTNWTTKLHGTTLFKPIGCQTKPTCQLLLARRLSVFFKGSTHTVPG